MTPVTNLKPGDYQADANGHGTQEASAVPAHAKGGDGDVENTTAGTALQNAAPTPPPGPPDKANQLGKRAGAIPGKTVDDHSVWEQARRQLERSAEAIRRVVEDAALEVGPGRIPMQLADAITELGIGDIPGVEEQQVSAGGSGSVDWRRQLRTYVGQLFQVRPVFNRPPRRFPELVGVVPGKRRRSDKPKIMAVLDTSGSITPDLLDIMNAEFAKLGKLHEVIVVECDCEIQDVYKYRKLGAVKGRGGTDFPPGVRASLSGGIGRTSADFFSRTGWGRHRQISPEYQ